MKQYGYRHGILLILTGLILVAGVAWVVWQINQ